MKIAIIGGGNMGGAIARGLAERVSDCRAEDITVIDVNQTVLDGIDSLNYGIRTARNDNDAVRDADLVIIALKPWLVVSVLEGIKVLLDYDRQMIVSVAPQLSFDELNVCLKKMGGFSPVLFKFIPNTAVAVGESMSFLASCNATEEQKSLMLDLFGHLGRVMPVEESLIPAGTALASCGIAFAFRYIRAAMEAGVEIGFYPDQAKEIVLQTLQGAVDVLMSTGNHPEQEIDKVTTPGGITIKGLNAMEEHGFTNAVIQGVRASRQ